MPGTPLPGRFPLSEAAVLLPAPARDIAYSSLRGHGPHPGGIDHDDVRICARGMRELDRPEDPASEHDH
jgi:hypothetical protein